MAAETFPQQDVVELSKQGYFTILLDENLLSLETGLEDDGFKVIAGQPGLKDEELKRKARGWAILTKNSQDFVHDAVRFDYDVIGIEEIESMDDAAQKITAAVTRSQIGTRKGNFWLRIHDNGFFHLEQLV